MIETGIAQLLVGPCLSFQVTASETEWAMDSTAIQTKRIQFDAWATDYATAKQIEAALSFLLDGYTGTLPDGTQVIGCFGELVIDSWEPNSKVYRVMAEYSVQF